MKIILRKMTDFLTELYNLILQRKEKRTEKSYTALLFNKGRDEIIRKVGEEATEVVIAAKNGHKKEIISEVADLYFHLLILMAQFNINPDEIIKELKNRKLRRNR